MTSQVITGNRLADGIVVYLAADGGWTENVNASRVIKSDGELQRMKALADAAAKAAAVVEPYAIEVAQDAGGVRPVRYRERIRAFGPSVHPDFAKRPALPRVA